MGIPVNRSLFALLLATISCSCALLSPDYSLKQGEAALNRNDYSGAVSWYQTALPSRDARISNEASLGLCRAEYEAAVDGKQVGDAFGGEVQGLAIRPLQLSNEWVPVVSACTAAKQRGKVIPTEIDNFLCRRDFDLQTQRFHLSWVNLRVDDLNKSQWCENATPSVRDESYAKIRNALSGEIEACRSRSCDSWELNELVDRYVALPGSDLRQAAIWRGKRPESGPQPITLNESRAERVETEFKSVISTCYRMIEDPGLSYPAQIVVNQKRIIMLTMSNNLKCVFCKLLQAGLTSAEISGVPHCLGYDEPFVGFGLPDAIQPPLAGFGECIERGAAGVATKPQHAPLACRQFN